MRHGNLLSQVTIATDPVYLTEPYIRSQEFVQMERGNTNWLYNCEYAMEVPRDKNVVPHYLPGQNPWLGEFEAKHAMPQDGVRGGAETLLPEWKPGAAPARAEPGEERRLPARGAAAAARRPARCSAVHVQGNVHMIVGAGANIAVQVGEDGILVVDTGAAGRRDKVLAAIKAAGAGQGDPLDRQHHVARRSHRRQRAGVEGRPDGQRQHRRDRRARERRARMIEARRARRGAAVQHLLRGVARLPVQRRAGDPLSRRVGGRRYRHRGDVPPLRRDCRRRRLPTDSYPGDRRRQRRQHPGHDRRAQPACSI